LTSGTILENTKLPLTVWFLAMHLLTQAKNNVAGLELMRHLGVCYRTAWLIKHKLPEVMRQRGAGRQLTGRIEVDDAYLGGERHGGTAGRGSENKVSFVAAVQTTELGHPHLPRDQDRQVRSSKPWRSAISIQPAIRPAFHPAASLRRSLRRSARQGCGLAETRRESGTCKCLRLWVQTTSCSQTTRGRTDQMPVGRLWRAVVTAGSVSWWPRSERWLPLRCRSSVAAKDGTGSMAGPH
jgi:hypothetical protein